MKLSQGMVEAVALEAMDRGARTLDELRAAVREAFREAGGDPAELSDYGLQIAVSRLCKEDGTGTWEAYPAYSRPPRYVSRRRTLELVRRAEGGMASAAERRELVGLLEDLMAGVRHWRARHRRALELEQEIQTLIDDITIRAFAGHYGELI